MRLISATYTVLEQQCTQNCFCYKEVHIFAALSCVSFRLASGFIEVCLGSNNCQSALPLFSFFFFFLSSSTCLSCYQFVIFLPVKCDTRLLFSGETLGNTLCREKGSYRQFILPLSLASPAVGMLKKPRKELALYVHGKKSHNRILAVHLM